MIQKFDEFVNESRSGVMTINDFSEIFSNFYDNISEVSEFLDKETINHLKAAKENLDKAWESEAEAHGVDFEKYKMKL